MYFVTTPVLNADNPKKMGVAFGAYLDSSVNAIPSRPSDLGKATSNSVTIRRLPSGAVLAFFLQLNRGHAKALGTALASL